MVFSKIFKHSKLACLSLLLFAFFFVNNLSAEDYKLKNINGQEVSYKDIIASPKTILFIWTTWCPYCRTEINNINEKYDFLKDVNIYYINTGERATTVKRFLKKYNLKEEILAKIIIDPAAAIADKFYVTGIPTYIFLKDSKYADSSLYISKDIIDKAFRK
ncbi:MAG: TlpA family protein disulfide reductase [Candidatus Omnitrophica bacterium]|nr:TlpA family protein disulfide reductase [Candidatus Omnitrophota bacterium]